MSIFNIKSKSLSQAGFWAYTLILLNTISGFIISPFILRCAGEHMYGVYSTMVSFAATLTIVDIGVTQTLMRYIAKYNAEGRNIKEISELCKSAKYINYVIVALSLTLSVVLLFNIDNLYSQTFTREELRTAKLVFAILSLSLITTIASNYNSGIISGNGYFTFIQVVNVTRVVCRLILVLLVVFVTSDVVAVAIVDLSLSLLGYLAYRIFAERNISIPNSASFASKAIFVEMLIYTGFVFFQSVVDQVNNNMGNIMIGSLVGPAAVATFSFGLIIFHMFQQLSTSISQMLLPYMSDMIGKGATPREFEKSLEMIGKAQFIIVGGVFFAFIVLGKGAIQIWLGDGYDVVWYISLILMFGGLVPLIQNGAIAILRARNLMAFRSFALFIMALINVVATYFFVKYMGFEYAAVATSLGFILINFILMDIYYYIKLKLNMFRVLWNVVKLIGPCNIPAMLVAFLIYKWIPSTLTATIIGGVAYIAIYFGLLWILMPYIDKTGLIKNTINKYIGKKDGKI